VFLEILVERKPTIGGSFYQVNSASRRLGLQSQDAVRWALVQAQTAVDTPIQFGNVQCRNLRVFVRLLIVVWQIHIRLKNPLRHVPWSGVAQV
jgi:hypothetical protein